ncbi:MAG: response regulator [Planctomycetes bacterium]|nr:response regulator [Planctomycetota bacterium]
MTVADGGVDPAGARMRSLPRAERGDLGQEVVAGRILVLDDKPRIASLISLVLSTAGYEVRAETDPHRALATARAERIDLVLCDIVMPAMSGYDFCERLKSDPATCGIPFLFVTSKEEREGALTGDIVGADGYIEKPFDQDVLLAKVRETMERNARRRSG